MRKLPLEPEYYRFRKPGAAPAPQPAPGPSLPGTEGPVPDGEVWGEANTATVGPLRALFTRAVQEVAVPCAVSPLGVNNQPVRLAFNNYSKPLYVRVKLARNSTEGRIAIAPKQAFNGLVGADGVEWLDLVTAPDRKFEALLMNGEGLWAVGTWPGIVPLSVFVSVAVWNP